MQHVRQDRGSLRHNAYQPKPTTASLTWQFAKLYCPCDHSDHSSGCANEIMVGWKKCKECSKGHP
jgi:hypothetical protein